MLEMPDWACRSLCNRNARRIVEDYNTQYAAWLKAREAHADAIDAWARAGEHGPPPAEPEEPDQPDVRWRPGDPLVCERDRRIIARILIDLDMLAAMLAAHADGHRGAPASDYSRVSGTKTAPSPSPAVDLLDQLLGDLLAVEDAWRTIRGYAPRDTQPARGAHLRSRTIAWLSTHLDEILAHPDTADEFGDTIIRWEARLRAATHDDPPTKTLARCTRSDCGERRIVWDRETRYYRCAACGTLYTQAELDRLEWEQTGATPQEADAA